MRLRTEFIMTFLLATCLAVGSASAFKSKKAPTLPGDSESKQKATSAFNDAVKHIDKAKKIGAKSDSTYEYNYQATTDPKVKGEYEEAVKGLQQAVTLNPSFKEAENNLGYCCRKLGKLTESLAAYDKAIALDSNFTQAREYRGETYLALNRLADAQGELAFLQAAKSPYADQLAHSIALYQSWQTKKDTTTTKKW